MENSCRQLPVTPVGVKGNGDDDSNNDNCADISMAFPVQIFTGRTISCTGATVHQGERANVTCHYNSDLSVTYDSFYIARWGPGQHQHRKASC